MTQRIGPSHAEEAGASPVATSQAATAVTRRLLACGMAATPLFAVVATAQILTRDGFDLRRHVVSMLSNGHLGWIQIANFTVSGLLFLAGAVGIRRAMRPNQDLSQGFRRGGTWGPRLIGVFAVGLLAAAVFDADPMNGFPPVPRQARPRSQLGTARSISPLRRWRTSRCWGPVSWCSSPRPSPRPCGPTKVWST